jgi:hypothetical protein
MATGTTKESGFLAPERLYSLKGFQTASGISATRMRQARRAGVTPQMLQVGRRKFISGASAIKYLEQLSRLNQTA